MLDDYERLREFEPANRERDGFWWRATIVMLAAAGIVIVMALIASI